MKISRHEKAIRTEREVVATELAELTAEPDRIEVAREETQGRVELLRRLLDTPAEKGNGEDPRDE